MHNIRRKLLSQNFLHSHKLITHLVGRSSIGKNDLVVEIGPGKGSITEQLLEHAGHVIAVELDAQWYRYLQEKFRIVNNLTLYQADFLTHSLPVLPYKVFANIPFAIEGKIIRKLIESPNPPLDSYLVVMGELAYRLSAQHRENMFSVMHKPWFDFSIAYRFRPQDFTPIPSVHPVLFRFTMKSSPLLPWEERKQYREFVQKAFADGQPVRNNLRKLYPVQHIDEVLQQLSLNRKIRPSYLHVVQWAVLYKKLNRIY